MKMKEILREFYKNNNFVGDVMKAMLCYEVSIKPTELNEKILQVLDDTLEIWRDNDNFVSFVDNDIVDTLELKLKNLKK